MDQLVFLALPLLLLYLLFARSRRQQRSLAATQAQIGPGQWVMTTSGLYGQVISTSEESVVLEVAVGVRTTWARQAVARVLDAEPGTSAVVVPDIDLTAGDTADDGDDRVADSDPPKPNAALPQDDRDGPRLT